MPATFIGHYEIVRKLADGGVGEVFEALDHAHDSRVVLKSLRPELPKRAELLQHFRSQIRALALLVHPNIARVRGFFEEAGQLYLAVEFVEGETLDLILRKNGRLEPASALPLFQQVLRALAFAHRTGFVHGNLKPSNVIVSHSGAVKVLDFGLARAFGRPRKTRAGYLVGNPRYLSPEQIRGEPADPRCDIYSLGIILYELLVGHPPFDSQADDELLRAQVEAIPLPPSAFFPDIPESLDAFFRRALAKSRAGRFQSVGDMARALRLRLESTEAPRRREGFATWVQNGRAIGNGAARSLSAAAARALSRFGEARGGAGRLVRERSAAATRAVLRAGKAANPARWARRVGASLRASRSRLSSAIAGAAAPIQESLARGLATSRQALSFSVRLAGRALASFTQNLAEKSSASFKYGLHGTRAAAASTSRALTRMVETVRREKRSRLRRPRYAFPALALAAFALHLVLFPESGGDRALEEAMPAAPVKPHPKERALEQPKPRTAAGARGKNQESVAALKPARRVVTRPQKEPKVEVFRKEPDASETRELARLPAPASSAKESNPPALREQRRIEPSAEKNSEERSRAIRLNVRWEN
ncbi:MAG TPA: serine/threonine-protein kinase [Candidatus Acidoferrales bacterium]|nr:serine/threonine-protein kinase [Candidatus Acidoferrales bacterium]